MTKRLLIVGTGGYAKEVAQIVRRIDPDCDTWNPISYVAVSAAEKGNAHLFGRVDYCDDEVFGKFDGGLHHCARRAASEAARRVSL